MVKPLEFLTDYNALKERFVSQVLIDSIFDADLMQTRRGMDYGITVRKLFTVGQVMDRYEKVRDFDV